MAFSLKPPRFGKIPWHCRVVVSRQHPRQQQYAPAAPSTTNDTAEEFHDKHEADTIDDTPVASLLQLRCVWE